MNPVKQAKSKKREVKAQKSSGNNQAELNLSPGSAKEDKYKSDRYTPVLGKKAKKNFRNWARSCPDCEKSWSCHLMRSADEFHNHIDFIDEFENF